MSKKLLLPELNASMFATLTDYKTALKERQANPSPTEPASTHDPEREAFNTWAKANGYGQSQPATWAWEAWQARAALASKGDGA